MINPSPLQIPGYKINEYKIILSLHDDLAQKIMTIQKDFIAKFKIENTKVYVPQLILVTFKQYQINEAKIIHRLKMVGIAYHPLKIELKNFGSFPSHTIYIQVTSHDPVKDLVKKIREESQRLMIIDKENKPHFINDANITIARKLKPWQYEESWKEYCTYDFTGKFVANKMILLKKREGEYKYSPIENIEFQNLPVETIQGELFF